MNGKVILKCIWFKQILKKKIAFTISVHSHVHPSSKQEYMQTPQQVFEYQELTEVQLISFYDRYFCYKLVNIKKLVLFNS